jgi:lipopolysaccharide export system permease protein
MDKIINKYLIFGFLKIVANVILVFICLGIILNLFEEIEFFKDLDQNLSLPIFLTILYIPNLIIKLLPFIIFISAMWFLISLNSNKDLLSLKMFGYSNAKIILILSSSALIFGIIVLIVFSPLTSSMVKYYEQKKADYSKDVDHLVSINKNGVWIKELISNNLRITTAKGMRDNFLSEVTIYNLDRNNKIINRIDSEYVDISDLTWKFATAFIFNPETNNTELIENFTLISIYNVEKLNSVYRNMDTLSFVELILKYENLIEKGYSKKILIEKMNRFVSLPLFLFLMVVLASIFTIGSVNKSQNLYYIFISIVTCVIIYYFKDLSIALGQTNRIPLVLSVWMPIIAISLFCLIGVLQINEK